MKLKYKFALFLLAVAFFSPVYTYTSSAQAWRNGGAYCRQPTFYKTSSNVYGTHDYIAEYALKYIMRLMPSFPQDKFEFLKYIWNDKYGMLDYFLAGTDMPDAVRAYDSKTKQFISYSFETRCGNKFVSSTDMQGFQTINHQARYDITGNYIGGSLKPLAEHLTNKLCSAFLLRDGQLAAYYLGAICHVISDATFYTHLVDGVSFPYWADYADNVQILTKTRANFHVLHTTFFEPEWAYEYFAFQGKAVKRSPALATVKAGKETWLGGGYLVPAFLLYDATEMKQYNPGDSKDAWDYTEKFLVKGINYWKYNDREYVDSYATVEYREYWRTVEFHINTAIYFCMSMMAKVIEGYQGVECNGVGEYGGQLPSQGSQNANANTQAIQQRLDNYNAFFALSLIGVMFSLLALSLSLKVPGINLIFPIAP